jgi:hypothetical protein
MVILLPDHAVVMETRLEEVEVLRDILVLAEMHHLVETMELEVVVEADKIIAEEEVLD